MYYNAKISAKANANIRYRKRVVALQKHILFIAAVLVVSGVILFGSAVITFARSNQITETIKTEYQSVQIQAGDTLWGIAEDNAEQLARFDISKKEFVDSLVALNQLKSDQIHSGQFLVVPVYSAGQ